MRPDDPPFIRHRRFEEALEALDDPPVSGLLVIGPAAIGKTSLLRMIEIELSTQERPVFSVSLNFRRPDELGARVIDAIRSSTFGDAVARRRRVRGSAGVSLDEAAEVLRAAAAKLPPVVLLLDDLDAAPYPGRTAAAVEDLARRLPDWKLVVASRPIADEYVGFDRFRRIELGELGYGEARRLVEIRNPELSADSVAAIVERAEGNPLVLTLLAAAAAGGVPLDRLGEEPGSTFARRLVEAAIESTPEAETVQLLLEQLALTGGRAHVDSVAAKLRLPEDVVRRLADIAAAHGLVTWQDDESALIAHALISEVVLARGPLAVRFRLADLDFGAEEAEKDTLLDESYVRRPSLDRLLEQRHSIVIGDRGSGKSAIFRKLASPMPEAPSPAGVTVCPVANSSELMPRITGAGSEVDAIRAAWLVVTAAVVASAVPASAPKSLRNTAADLRAAFGLPGAQASLGRRILRVAARPLAGTVLRFAVGPVNLEAQLPAGRGTPGASSVDIESFLHAADGSFGSAERRVVVMFDRIDETFKYNRPQQEALVQALLLAEAHVSILKSVRLLVFLRTDLYELYDIQEKTKLVSRMVTLEWSEEDWLRLLVNRVLANPPLQSLAETLRGPGGIVDLRAALEALFPAEIEGQHVERWLVDSIRNGKGAVSPRLAVLLLYKTRDFSRRPDDVISRLPLFDGDAVRAAMTHLSKLSYEEIVDDFKVAPSFVRNCRAGGLASFALDDVRHHFDADEGEVNEQVQLLERLGFLERVVIEGETSTSAHFRIPKLYTRGWDHA